MHTKFWRIKGNVNVKKFKKNCLDFYKKKIISTNDLILTKGNDLTIFTTGNILENVYKAVKNLEKDKGYKIKS